MPVGFLYRLPWAAACCVSSRSYACFNPLSLALAIPYSVHRIFHGGNQPVTSLPKAVRLQEFLRRLGSLPAAKNHDQARAQLEETLNAVEDELSGVVFNPDNWRTDGRMYPAQDDSAADVDGHPGVTSYRHRGHETFIAENGAFEIRSVKGDEVLIEKPGADGKGVWS